MNGRINFRLTWPVELYQQKKEEGNFIITERHHLIRPLLILHWEGCAKILRKSLWRDRREALLRFETGTKCHDHPREIVGRSRQNCLNNMADGAIYEGKLDLCSTLVTFAGLVKPFHAEKCSNINNCKLCVKLVKCRMRAILMAPIPITRAYEA